MSIVFGSIILERYCFESDKFRIIAGEDDNTNPGIYGLELSQWLKQELINLGYSVQEVLAEDWGWCIICYDKPFLLWVGCQGQFYDKKLIWSCFVEAEKPLFRNPLKKIDMKQALDNLNNDIFKLLSNNFLLIDCP